LNGKVLIGAGNGYYLTSDPHVVEDQIESIQGRINSMSAVVDSMKAELISLKRRKTA
jgi:prefoldin subunit 5